MGFAGALGQLGVVVGILTAGALYTRHHVQTLERADHSNAAYMEDSKAGNGTRYRVVTRAADTDGAYYTVEVLARGTAAGFVSGLSGSLPGHEHLLQQEEVTVQRGKLGYFRAREGGVLAAGEKLVIPQGTAHLLYNADNSTDVLYEITHRPAGPLGESFFENLAGLGWDYNSLDRIHPLQVLVIYDAAGIKLTDVPGFLRPIVNKVLVPTAKLLGFKAEYPTHKSAAAAADSQDAAAASAEASEEVPDAEAETEQKEEL